MIVLALKCWFTKAYSGKDYCKEKDIFQFKSDLIFNQRKDANVWGEMAVRFFAMPVHLALMLELADAIFLSILIGVFDGKADL